MEIIRNFTTQPLSLASEESPVVYKESIRSTCLREVPPWRCEGRSFDIRISNFLMGNMEAGGSNGRTNPSSGPTHNLV